MVTEAVQLKYDVMESSSYASYAVVAALNAKVLQHDGAQIKFCLNTSQKSLEVLTEKKMNSVETLRPMIS